MSAIVQHTPGREYVPEVPAQEEKFVVTLTLSRTQLQAIVDRAAYLTASDSGLTYDTWAVLCNAVGGHTGPDGTHNKEPV